MWKNGGLLQPPPPAGDLADELMIIGIVAYANKQADILHKMARIFIDDWYHLLKSVPFDVPWLADHECPPECPSENKWNRLASNVQRYHPALYVPEDNPGDKHRNGNGDAPKVFHYYADAETLQDTLEDSL